MSPRRNRIPPHLRAAYQLIRKYPGVSNNSISEMMQNDERVEKIIDEERHASSMLSELRELVEDGEAPAVVSRALEIHDRMSRAGLGDGFRYIVRSVERGDYIGVKDIQFELGRYSNSFQKKFNARLTSVAEEYDEIMHIYQEWLRLRYFTNPIVQKNLPKNPSLAEW